MRLKNFVEYNLYKGRMHLFDVKAGVILHFQFFISTVMYKKSDMAEKYDETTYPPYLN
jgi:hypothetical protein